MSKIITFICDHYDKDGTQCKEIALLKVDHLYTGCPMKLSAQEIHQGGARGHLHFCRKHWLVLLAQPESKI